MHLTRLTVTILLGKKSTSDLITSYQDEEVDKTLYRQFGEVSRSLPLVLVGEFNFPDICRIYNTADREQSQRFLECVGDNFVTQLVKEATRGSKILDLLFLNR